MAKLYVAFAGLLGVVKRDDAGVVLARKLDKDEYVHGHKVPRHIARTIYRNEAEEVKEYPLKGEVISFSDDLEDDLDILELNNYLHFAHLLHASGRPTITKPGCTAKEAGRDCQELVAARVLGIKGKLYPVWVKRQDSELWIVGKPKIRVKGRYRPENKQKKEDFVRDPVANGLLLEADYGDKPVVLTIGGASRKLGKAKEEDLRRIDRPENEDARIVWIENVPADHDDHDSDEVRDEAEDMHFWFLYDFLVEDHKNDRWVPFAKLPTEVYKGRVRVIPGSQCITPVLP